MLFINSLVGKAFFIFLCAVFVITYLMVLDILFDIGFGFEIKNVYYSGIIVIIFAVTLALYILVK